MTKRITTDVLIIGGGVAGLTAALDINTNVNITIITKGKVSSNNSFYAQGGVAVALKEPSDIPVHKNDTLKTGCEMYDEDAVNMLVTEGPDRVWDLIHHGVRFDKNQDNEYELLREAAHSSRRIMHVRDKTGFSIQTTLLQEALKRPNIKILGNFFLNTIITRENSCFGAKFIDGKNGKNQTIYSKCTIIATGGAGAVYEKTTNWEGSTGDGLSAAYLAGARIRDMEFYQFHPTAILLEKGDIKNFLISESVRGEGATIVNQKEERFLYDYDARGELAPRDIVARAIYDQLQKNNKVFLDMRIIKDLTNKFPVIYSNCLKAGIDLTKETIRILPAAHYMIGGIQTDTTGKSSINNLYACGEVASTGVHGANRLASNSLLECMVFAHKSAEHINKNIIKFKLLEFEEITAEKDSMPKISKKELTDLAKIIKEKMYAYAGIKRNKDSLLILNKFLEEQYKLLKTSSSKEKILLTETKNILITAKLIAANALKRKESRGTHYRDDFPHISRELDYVHFISEISVNQ